MARHSGRLTVRASVAPVGVTSSGRGSPVGGTAQRSDAVVVEAPTSSEPPFDWEAFSNVELEVGGGGVSVVDDQLRLDCREFTSWEEGAGSWVETPADGPLNLWNHSITVHWEFPDGLADPREVGLYLFADDSREGEDRFSMGTDGVNIYFNHGRRAAESITWLPGGAEFEPWWRIQHDANAEEIQYLTSPDGVTWTEQWAFPNAGAGSLDAEGWTEEVLSNLDLIIEADRWDVADEPFYVYLDNLEMT